VLNDGHGVLLRIRADKTAVDALLGNLHEGLPPLARIDRIEIREYRGALPAQFRIAESGSGGTHTEITPDAAICAACSAEIRNPHDRRYRYPFANCTQCGPRLSIVTAVPYDRGSTTMAQFAPCAACDAEYRDPSDRRFHAEPIACPACGPAAELIALDRRGSRAIRAADPVEAAARLIADGAIVAIKGLGGYHLACDARNRAAVVRLRHTKRRPGKPFALMAPDLATIRRYCTVEPAAERALTGLAAPIVLLPATGPESLPDEVAPGLNELGFMLPAAPLHLLLLADCNRPLVMTSGNRADEPPITDDGHAQQALAGIADYVLRHDRRIASRVDDSVVRVMAGAPRVLRRARGFAPEPVRLPPGFETAPALLAMGGELKATFCLVQDGGAILSQHLGDLEQRAVFNDYYDTLALYDGLFDHTPTALVIDDHPDYLSSKRARGDAAAQQLPVIAVQHHHAHVAACLTENQYPLDAAPVLGIVLDGLGYGEDGSLWGGEFLLADYRTARRLAHLKPVAMPGGAQAVREPWRNLYAHLLAAGCRDAIEGTPILSAHLRGRPLRTMQAMIVGGLNAPLASSCGRLFDAVAAALDLCGARQAYEGEAAMRLETLAGGAPDDHIGYPFVLHGTAPRTLDPTPLWHALLADLASGVPPPRIARRFHRGLANAVTATVIQVAGAADTVALSGGCLQNRLLSDDIAANLAAAGFSVLSHARVPANDGGLALGQATIGAARLIGG
jgi:hydrogenase maturation protein HypF